MNTTLIDRIEISRRRYWIMQISFGLDNTIEPVHMRSSLKYNIITVVPARREYAGYTMAIQGEAKCLRFLCGCVCVCADTTDLEISLIRNRCLYYTLRMYYLNVPTVSVYHAVVVFVFYIIHIIYNIYKDRKYYVYRHI